MDDTLDTAISNNPENETLLTPFTKKRVFRWKSLDVRIKLLILICILTTVSNLIFFLSSFDFKKEVISNDNQQSVSISNYTSYTSPISFLNASFMFNSINSFLKQKDSDIFPVGLSYVPASIIKDTVVYHAGSGIPDGFEWLAMDVEFSMVFADRTPADKRGLAFVEHQKYLKLHPGEKHRFGPKEEIDFCSISEEEYSVEIQRYKPPTLMSFRLKHDLDKLIYLDGASASKAKLTGEMDTQVLLYNQIKAKYPEFEDPPKKFMKERDHAEKICAWAKTLGIQGYIRLELGFEIVLCDFHEHLEMISNVSVTPYKDFVKLPDPVEISKDAGWPINCTDGNLIEEDLTPKQKHVLDLENMRYKHMKSLSIGNDWEWLKAGHKQNKGEKKIALDYRYLVSAINRTELDIDNYQWKIVNEDEDSEELQADIFTELLEYVSSIEQFKPSESTNWQLKTEGIIQKFSPYLKAIEQILNNTEVDIPTKSLKISELLYPLIKRYTDKNISRNDIDDIINMGVWEYTYPVHELRTEADNLIFSSLVTVTREIFVFLIDLHELCLNTSNEFLQNGEIKSPHKAELMYQQKQKAMNELMKTLNWVSFGYDCTLKCGVNEICFTASWGPSPLGWNPLKDEPRDEKDVQKERELPPGFFKDTETGFNRLKNEQVCLGLDSLIDMKITW